MRLPLEFVSSVVVIVYHANPINNPVDAQLKQRQLIVEQMGCCVLYAHQVILWIARRTVNWEFQ